MIVSERGSVPARSTGAGDTELHYEPEATERYPSEHPQLEIDGSADFVARTTADIGVMLSTEQGRGLLDDLTAALRDEGGTMKFIEKEDEAGGSYSTDDNTVRVGMWAELYGDGSNRVPLPVMFHEMVHGYQDLVSGFPEGQTTFEGAGSTDNLGRQATGLPWIDEEGTFHPADELVYTDNQFRGELRLEERTTYGGETGDPTGFQEDAGDHGGHEHPHDVSARRYRRSFTVAR